MPKLTKSHVDRLRPRGQRYEVKCDTLQGFVIRVNTDGSKTAVVRYSRDGKDRRYRLGKLGEHYPFTMARSDAQKILRSVERGNDPARDRELHREAATFAAVATRYMTEVAEPYREASTVRSYRGLLKKHVLPALGTMRITEIERTDVLRLHQQIGATSPGAANRTLALVSVIMTHAETWGYRPLQSNPCYRFPRFKGRKMERYLSPEERARLDEVLREGEQAGLGHEKHLGSSTVAAVRLLSLTGARSGEILTLQWSMVDLDRACLRIPRSKTGAKVIPLSLPAVELLRDLKARRREGEAFVCPCKEGNGPLQNFRASWRRIRERAGLSDVRAHDLRHSAASDGAEAGLSLPQIGQVLGHKNPQTTARYAHLADRVSREAARLMGEQIERNTREGAERLRQERERAKLAAGAEHGEGEASAGEGEGEGATVIPMGATVIPFPGRARG